MANEITYFRGDFYPKVITFTDKSTKQPIDLTGATLIMTVNTEKDPVDTTNQLFQITGVVGDDPLLGKASFTPTKQNTDQNAGKYWYDVAITVGSLSSRTVLKSNFIITMDIGKD